ncbi:hypothetical protein CHL67_05195 [Prosthecochloris sp. GSB1]|uniref:carboxypeptidase-like regulatory domain-containing protein n=1 Tax=Prosthecochloris sp. GSB1 TaxID=281093 RepID=UPI000B8CB155|nr:carboxypeptidase regulatory-like domain-containing protein [Prosthecochloris sp. GSB1]ASQ90398.1 hypothetical protein CHL67_05195 [Prosthecochloris sp. GSB1]
MHDFWKAMSFSLVTFGLFCIPSAAKAEPEGDVANTATVAAAPGVMQPETILVEVFVNKKSIGTHICYILGEEYWVPFSLFEQEARIEGLGKPEGDGALAFETTLGKLTWNPSKLRKIEQTECISFSDLEKSFYVRGRFVQSIFGIALDVPWVPGKATGKKREIPEIVPDIEAPSSSISFLRLEPDITYDFGGEHTKNLLIETGGRLLGGVWDITWTGDPEERYPARNYHWTTYNNHSALRIGTGSSDLFSLVGNVDFTGIQYGWNNHSILNQLDFERYSDSDVFLSFDRSQNRTIEGNAPPASIAELRLDGVVVARQRINLNGRYVFRNVRMTSDLRKTQVFIYERSLQEKPLAVIDHTMSITNRALPAHEILVRAGGGVDYNPLDNDGDQPTSWTGFGHVLYGVSNRVTLESGIQYNPETREEDLVTGAVLSVGGNWALALYGARSNQRYGSDIRLEGNGEYWNLSYLARFNQEGFARDNLEDLRSHNVRFSTDIFHPFDLLLYGKYLREGNEAPDEYLLPGLYWYVFPQLMLSALPNDDERYRYEANIRFASQSDLTVTYENEVASADLGVDFGRSLSSRALYSRAFATGSDVASLYFDWYPGANRYDLVRAGVSQSGDQRGFSIAWNKFFNTGLQLSLQYSYNMNNALQLDTEDNFSNLAPPDAREYFTLALTWDIGRSGSRFYPINRTAISHTRGGLAGSLKIMNETNLGSSDIDNVSILLNNRKLGQRQVDGSFFVGNLKPGVYAVDVDTENLPLELNVKKKTTYAEVLNGSITQVDIPVYAEYSVAGRITASDGKGVENLPVEVMNEKGETLSSTLTNVFGYYRTESLQPGEYRISVSGEERAVSVKNDYLYGVDFTVERSMSPATSVEAEETAFTTDERSGGFEKEQGKTETIDAPEAEKLSGQTPPSSDTTKKPAGNEPTAGDREKDTSELPD